MKVIKFIAAGIMASVIIAPSTAIPPVSTTVPKPSVYNKTERIFRDVEGGIEEDYLNTQKGTSHHLPELVSYYQEVDADARDYSFSPLGDVAPLSIIVTKLTSVTNILVINEVDKTNTEDLLEEHTKLKEMLEKCSLAYYETEDNNKERLERIYSIAVEYIKPGENTAGSVGIEELINGKKGDCNDVATAFDSIFKYYHIDSKLVFGKVGKGDETNIGSHAWITVKVDDLEFDLDPTWYKNFVPLEVRCLGCEEY